MAMGFVYRNGDFVGTLEKTDAGEYIFRYDDSYFSDRSKRSVSLTLPKSKQQYKSNELFPFFFNMLPEGVNKALLCRTLRIDENDYFSLLLAVGGGDTIGAVTVKTQKT